MNKKKILVVDDEMNICEMLAGHFSGRGYEVFTAQTVAQGLNLIFKEKPDITILDYNLPDHFGVEVLRQVNKIGSKVKIIILTANLDADLKTRLLKEGADFVLLKGISIIELENRVKELFYEIEKGE